jgi:molybdopterin-guanine dinucleotide biosynthesis protein A
MGRDKAAVVIAGTPLAERTAHLLQLVAEPVIEIGPGFTSLPRTSEQPPGSGPLAAMAAGAAELARCEYVGEVLVVATDLPRLTEAYLLLLARHPVPNPDHSVVPRDATGRPQPLCARYSATAVATAQALAAQGQRSMTALLAAVPITWLTAAGTGTGTGTGADVLRDIDTPEDLEAARRAFHFEPGDCTDEALRP